MAVLYSQARQQLQQPASNRSLLAVVMPVLSLKFLPVLPGVAGVAALSNALMLGHWVSTFKLYSCTLFCHCPSTSVVEGQGQD